MTENEFPRWQTDFASFEESYLRHYVALADTKAAAVFGLSSAIFAYMLSNQKFLDLITADWTSERSIVGSIAIAGLVLTAFHSIWVVMPRLPKGAEGIIFFGAVKNLPSGLAYRQKVAECSESQLTAARLDHCYTLAQICWSKYVVLRRAIWIGLSSVILLVFISPSIASADVVSKNPKSCRS
ncbi:MULTISPECIES: Pycsar system effector family protein [unclassified Novosphingobium]|uniref:Pycsar system effector family protein n=1 Tax=unclassified Novosphingobium TaxID=2644732 RepID=UPI0025F49726|nr:MULTISPECIES: Pycsar system effector family protein [unclassified Novosphingobium]HQV03037.1 DUF5706 domain-containing protein [Novosphingobium sp.]